MRRKSENAVNHQAAVGPETFRFFRELGRNNSKAWMDENRERYQSAVVEPMRGLLAQLTPAVLQLYPGFDVCGRTGVNFSRINRDIRFAKDKTPYRPQMYLVFPDSGTSGPDGGKSRRPGELYVGVNAKLVTAGYRVYFDGKTKANALGARIAQAPKWCARQKRRIGRGFESYWYSLEKGGAWTKNNGWPVTPEGWKKLKAWVVRRKLPAAAASRPGFAKDVAKIFRDVMPLFQFVCG